MRRAAVVALAVLSALALAAGCGGDRSAAQRFLDAYEQPDGRVVRTDQGGDTVSEGQAYAMLLAAATGDEQRFDAAWGWARAHLQRPDGLLSWHWQDGRVVGSQPAADADLDAARALLVAARRFDRPALRAQARRIAGAAATRDGVLLAGPWAAATGTVNPSYLWPATAQALGRPTGASIRVAERLTRDGHLPPDWATLPGVPARSPSGAEAVYGFDAVRLPVRFATSCSPAARRVAARLWPALLHDSAALPRTLTGPPAADAHPQAVALVGAAGAADAAGDSGARDRLLDRAEALEREHPSYYGAAWVALGRVLLQGDALDVC